MGAFTILILGWGIAGKSHRAAQYGRHPTAVPRPLVRYAVITITIVAVLSQFGVETTSIIAILVTASLAIGLALHGTLQNIAAGVMLILLRPFKVGDFFEGGGEAETVQNVGMFVCTMRTGAGLYITVPNS